MDCSDTSASEIKKEKFKIKGYKSKCSKKLQSHFYKQNPVPKVHSFLLARCEKEITWIRGNMEMLNLLRICRVKLSWPKSYCISGSYSNEHRTDFLLQRRHQKKKTMLTL